MRTRKHHVSVWMNEAELRHLKQQAELAGLKVDPYIRALIMGADLKPRPPDEWPELVRQVSAIGNNINQAVRHANVNKHITPEAVREIMQMQAAIWKKVKEI